MGGSFKKMLSKSPVQTVGMRLIQGDNLGNAIFKNSGTPVQRAFHQFIHKSYNNMMNPQGGSSYAMPKSSFDTSGMFAQQNQMLQDMQTKQRASNANLRSQSPSYSSGETQQPTTTLAQSKISDSNMPIDFPSELLGKSSASPKIAQSNTFQIPDLSNIKFGGV